MAKLMLGNEQRSCKKTVETWIGALWDTESREDVWTGVGMESSETLMKLHEKFIVLMKLHEKFIVLSEKFIVLMKLHEKFIVLMKLHEKFIVLMKLHEVHRVDEIA